MLIKLLSRSVLARAANLFTLIKLLPTKDLRLIILQEIESHILGNTVNVWILKYGIRLL